MKRENLVGIISDTHDNRSSIQKAVKLFNDAGCALVIHAGDYIAPFTSREFSKLEGDFIGVFGNNDGERKGLRSMFAEIGELHDPPFEFPYRGKRFVIMHDPAPLERYLTRSDIDIIVYGHLHEIDIRPGKPMIINPGECCSWLTGRSTLVIVDIESMEPKLVEVV